MFHNWILVPVMDIRDKTIHTDGHPARKVMFFAHLCNGQEHRQAIYQLILNVLSKGEGEGRKDKPREATCDR